MDTSKIVGEKIKSLRESQSISIEQLAERSGLAVEQIERIENNIDLPSLAPLIKTFPCRVIPRSADDFQIRIIFYVHNQSIAAGNDQSQKRRLQFRKGDIIGSNMPPHMVHRD